MTPLFQSGSKTTKAPLPPKISIRRVGHEFQGSRTRLDPENFYTLFKKFGDVHRFNLGPMPMFLFHHPEAIKYVVQDNNKNYTKGRGLRRASFMFGNGLLTSEGEFWRRQRRLAQPAFHRKQINGFVEAMSGRTAEMLTRWEQADKTTETFDISAEMMLLTLHVVTDTLFSSSLSDRESDIVARTIPKLLDKFERRSLVPFEFINRRGMPWNRHIQAMRDDVDHIVYRMIRERRESGEQIHDLMGMLMSAEDEETGETMSDEQLRDEVMTLFLAGHETTANLLTWTFYALSRDPHIREQLEAEVSSVLTDRTVSLEQIKELVYTRQVLEESMRLYPPAWIFEREAIEDDVVMGYRVPAKKSLLMSTYVVHRHPDFWEDPLTFDPTRFEPEKVKQRHRFAYVPFGGGPRLCIGNNFAIMEATIMLAMMVREYQLELLPGYKLRREASIVMRPSKGLQMTRKRLV